MIIAVWMPTFITARLRAVSSGWPGVGQDENRNPAPPASKSVGTCHKRFSRRTDRAPRGLLPSTGFSASAGYYSEREMLNIGDVEGVPRAACPPVPCRVRALAASCQWHPKRSQFLARSSKKSGGEGTRTLDLRIAKQLRNSANSSETAVFEEHIRHQGVSQALSFIRNN